MYVKVKEGNFIRDTNSMGLINTDVNAINEYNAKMTMIRTQREEINKVKDEINDVKSDVQEIKQLLLQLMDKK
jgi:hypothetical protein